jgi:phosphatidylserine/phosphatidylglycerophosphate/cardiolipin synthase-like enzyme
MHVLRARLVRKLQAADRFGRFHIYYPHIDGLKEGTCIDVHSKIMVVDDAFLRIGSANLNNRSMGLDTECDLALEAQARPELVQKIRRFRDRLLAEHAGVSTEEAAAAATGMHLYARRSRRSAIPPPAEAADRAA